MQCLLLVLQLVTAWYVYDVMIFLTKQLGKQMKKMFFIDASEKILQSSKIRNHVPATGP